MIQQAAEWQIPVCVMDCDVAAAFDHVSHHEIVRATTAMGVAASIDCRMDSRMQKFGNSGGVG